MNRFVGSATAALFLFAGSAAFAQDNNVTADVEPYYVQEGSDGVFMYREDDMDNRITVMGDTTYAVPAECPEGSFYRSGENTITACGEGGAVYNITELEEGAMTGDNQPFPEGTTGRAVRSEGDNQSN